MDKKARRLFDKYNPERDVIRCPWGRAQVREELDLYVYAALNLYGVISIKELVDLFNSHSDNKTSVEEIYILLLPWIRKNMDYAFYKDYLVNYQYIENLSWVENLLAHQEGKPLYKPTHEELLKYLDGLPYDYPQAQDLKAFLMREFGEIIGSLIMTRIRHYASLAGIFPNQVGEILEEEDLVFRDEEAVGSFIELLTVFNNNTRNWANRGYTPLELGKLQRKKRPKEEPRIKEAKRLKIGRNEPCPCGSGKKYKRCCYFNAHSKRAHLSFEEYMLFHDLWYGLLDFVNEKEKLVRLLPDQDFPMDLDDYELNKIRLALWDKPEYISAYLKEDDFSPIERDILVRWEKYHRKVDFFALAYKEDYLEILPLGEEGGDRLYGLKGLSLPLANILGLVLPVHASAVLLPFLDYIIFDGIMEESPITFGDGMKEEINLIYEKSKEKGVISSFNEKDWL